MGENINLKHKEITDEEMYQNLKKSTHTMNPEKWKKLRKKELKKTGRVWSN